MDVYCGHQPAAGACARDRVLASDAYSSMLFVHTIHECEQQKLIANERIAHQLRSNASTRLDPRVSSRLGAVWGVWRGPGA